ncbi:MAG TPA: F0F1 ATP synthase subunit A [Candidatus Paceibacterota bacterium]|jgi:F-type H+-transporting ATPase subunit a|nr:F0F1 ATP synthase subunit A [Candidatus Paceibacterota bacterium]
MENQINENQTEVSHEVTLYAEPVAHIGPLPVTNALLTSWAAVLFIIILVMGIRFKLKEIPKGIQNFFEIMLEGALSLCDQVTGSRKISNKVFPLAFSIFMFVLVNNWLGILPLGGLGLIEKGGEGLSFVPFIRSGTADINTTLALSLMSVISANIFGIVSIGAWKTFNKYVNIKALGGIFTNIRRDPMIIIVAPVTFFVGLLELIGEFAKVASLSFRLFGNVFAGEVLLVSMSALLAYGLPIPFLFLEIFVGVIQAFIFAILVLVYFTIASQDHDEHEEHPARHALQDNAGGEHVKKEMMVT